MSRLRRRPYLQEQQVREVHRLLELSDVQIYEKHHDRREMPGMRHGRTCTAEYKKEKNILRLHELSEVQHASWDKPVNIPCPLGDSTFLLEKYSKTKGNYYKCPKCESEISPEEANAANPANKDVAGGTSDKMEVKVEAAAK